MQFKQQQGHKRLLGSGRLVRTAATVVAVAILLLSLWLKQRDNVPADRPAGAPPATAATPPAPTEAPASVIPDQSIYGLEGEVVYRGDVNVGSTLARIAAGKRLKFPNDGSTFQNRERRLPRQAAGYYKEYVHPTPGLNGPGPQRIVTGQEGEIYYTADHYRTFRRLDKP
jgi:guanyl-specific ribonuclease Sa